MDCQQDPYFQMFEKRRLKVVEMHRIRRQQIFQNHRHLLSHPSQQTSQNSSQQTSYFHTSHSHLHCQHQKDTSAINNQNQDSFCSFEENEMKEGDQIICSSSKPFESTQVKKEREFNKKNNPCPQSRRYAKMIQIPSWMNVVPEDLVNFYCCAWPNGKTALLVFKQGKAILFNKEGHNIWLNKNIENDESFHSLSGTILEIVLSETTNTLFITDVLIWKNNQISSETFGLRYDWHLSNFQVQLLNITVQGHAFKLVQYHQLKSQENLKKVYLEVGYEKNGLLFVHKQSPYVHGLNQNAMVWKDFEVSNPKDQNILKTKQTNQQMVPEKYQLNKNYIYGLGRLTKNGSIFSLEGYKIGKSQYSNVNGYIRYRIEGISFNHEQKSVNSIQVEDSMKNKMNIRLTGFEIIQYKKHSSGIIDPLSKIIYKFRTIYDPLTIQTIAGVLPISQ